MIDAPPIRCPPHSRVLESVGGIRWVCIWCGDARDIEPMYLAADWVKKARKGGAVRKAQIKATMKQGER